MEKLYTELKNGKLRLWADVNMVESDALAQSENVSSLPILAGPVALMPDVHLGKGATVGSVIPTRKAIIPASVGVDIGCGMLAVKFNMRANDLPQNLSSVRRAIESVVPVGFSENTEEKTDRDASQLLAGGFRRIVEKAPGLLDNRKTKDSWTRQIGSLGGGNHFVELSLDEEGSVWLMLHSGSRGIGNAIGTYYVERAKEYSLSMGYNLPDKDLAWLDEGTPFFDEYWFALEWAQQYARENRRVMYSRIRTVLKEFFPHIQVEGTIVNCHHNYCSIEKLPSGEEIYLTRKGAISAKKDEWGIIPGSMGTRSFIVKGLGNEASYQSCSHGAGRRMSRGKAKKVFTQEDLAEQTKGVECRKDAGVIDEIPGAYKDIDDVMRRQSDLVTPVHVLKQVLCVKG